VSRQWKHSAQLRASCDERSRETRGANRTTNERPCGEAAPIAASDTLICRGASPISSFFHASSASLRSDHERVADSA
jgi:hypothetical protein